MSIPFTIEYNGQTLQGYFTVLVEVPKKIIYSINHPEFKTSVGENMVIYENSDGTIGFSYQNGCYEEAGNFASLVVDKIWSQI